MAEESNIKQELLKQMIKDSAQTTGANSAQEILERDRAQMRRLKWMAAVSWLITILYLILYLTVLDYVKVHYGGWLTKREFWLVQNSDIGLLIFILIAILLTVSLYVKSRTLTIRQIYIRLANIEEQLKRMSQDK